MSKLVNISELSKMINLINPINDKPLNHVLRYWEKEFKQLKPKKINNRRYYTQKQVETVKMIKFLLKDKGMTINGVKNILNLNINKLDDYNSYSLKADYYKKSLKEKSNNLLKKIKKIKDYGKKNSPKS
jgi:DNA-binding transcriptional MerR regulator